MTYNQINSICKTLIINLTCFLCAQPGIQLSNTYSLLHSILRLFIYFIPIHLLFGGYSLICYFSPMVNPQPFSRSPSFVWCPCVKCQGVASQLRWMSSTSAKKRLLSLCSAKSTFAYRQPDICPSSGVCGPAYGRPWTEGPGRMSHPLTDLRR